MLIRYLKYYPQQLSSIRANTISPPYLRALHFDSVRIETTDRELELEISVESFHAHLMLYTVSLLFDTPHVTSVAVRALPRNL